MNALNRRQFLAFTGSTAGSLLMSPEVHAEGAAPSYDGAYAILYDATRCIGCRACMRRCRESHGLGPDREDLDGVSFDMPRELSERNFTVVQLHQDTEPLRGTQRQWSFLKKNCMHCNVPACASACPVAALQKTDRGPVVYYEDRCIGCRYCMMACPYRVPRYEWRDRMPRVRKCNLDGACVRACPVQALVDGPRKNLIAEAHRRIDLTPDRYVNRVYGEYEGGGTSYLILSGIPLEKMGLPKLSPTAPGHYAEPILSAVPGWVVGLSLFLGALHQLEKRQRQTESSSAPTPTESENRAPPRKEGIP